MSQLCRVGLVGRPNVGKSSLYNRLLGRRLAVVADQAGTTRDRLESEIELAGQSCVLFDLAGIEPALAGNELSQAVQRQVLDSLERADVLVWVVDGQRGSDRLDQDLAQLLRQLGRPVVVAVNKSDSAKHDDQRFEFARFGFEPIVTVSAVHGRGIRELTDALDQLVASWRQDHLQPEAPIEDSELRLSLIGRPNVGKSTLLNALAGSNRSVVSSVAGTTRDAVDTLVSAEAVFGNAFTKWKQVRVIDTAGVRRRGKMGHEIEAWSVVRTMDAIDRAEVVLLLLDATEGLVHQDLQVAQMAVDAGRAMVLVVNKWDLILAKNSVAAGSDAEQGLQERFLDRLRSQLPFMPWCQVLFLSAADGYNLTAIGRTVINAYLSWSVAPKPSDLRELTGVLQRNPRLKNLRGISLEHSQPPTFHLDVEGRDLPHFSTVRYVENALRDRFEIGSSPIKIWSVPSVNTKRGAKP